MIGKLADEPSANSFSEYLASKALEHEVERDDDGQWLVWIADEEAVESCQQDLARFVEEPEHEDFSVDRNRERVAKREMEAPRKPKRIMRREDVFVSTRSYGVGPLTCSIIGVCVILAFLTKFGDDLGRAGGLYIAEISRIGDRVEWYRGLVEIRRGEIWRVVTPIFLHGDTFHLLFNMMWFWTFASLIEARRGAILLVLLIVVSASLSNLLQYWMSGPLFVGMSGVNYALFGFLWMKGRFHPGSGMGVHPHSAILLMIWFFLCLSGWVGAVANWCHAGGLVIGGVWGFLTSPGAVRQLLDRD